MKTTFLFLFIACAVISYGQTTVSMDTVYLRLHQTDTSDHQFNVLLQNHFDSLVYSFQTKDQKVVFRVDTTQKRESVLLTMGPIRYVDKKHNVTFTAINAGLLGLNVALFAFIPPVIPFYLLPTTHCKVKVDGDESLVAGRKAVRISPSGYFRDMPKQQEKFEKHFKREMQDLLEEMHDQYVYLEKRK